MQTLPTTQQAGANFRGLSFEELKRHAAEWQDLADNAHMPNPY